jgi:beta-1,4-mannosyl-glycoprotein beta-1,4-N-acetylglucosaminyltransferase
MAIYDCFQYFNEDHLVDLRLNILNEYVDYFVISESTRTHQGEGKKLNFDIKNFSKFKNKIKYVVANFNENKPFDKHQWGESLIEQHQRNNIVNGIQKASDNDLIILSDSDEIPDLNKLNQVKKKAKFIAFSQMMFMYKLNLQNLNESNWIGSRMCLKKYFPVPQKLRNMKFKKYPFWRLDKPNTQIINGGWHFSFLQSPTNIVKKIKAFSHGEFNTKNIIDENNIKDKILSGKDIFERGFKLKKIKINSDYPNYIQNNKDKLIDWID